MRGEPLCAPQCGGRCAPPPPSNFLLDARGFAPLHSPVCRRSALHPGDFLPDEKVTKESPRAVPFGIPRCVVTALFALAPLCSDSRRATLNHRTRPICHFEFVGKSVLFFPLLTLREHFLLSIRGSAGGAPEDAGGFKLSRTIPLGHRAGGAKGAEVKAERFYFSPLRRRSRLLRSLEPGGSWRIFGDFLFVRKSPGIWGGAPIQRGVQRGLCPIGRVEPYRSNTIWA